MKMVEKQRQSKSYEETRCSNEGTRFWDVFLKPALGLRDLMYRLDLFGRTIGQSFGSIANRPYRVFRRVRQRRKGSRRVSCVLIINRSSDDIVNCEGVASSWPVPAYLRQS